MRDDGAEWICEQNIERFRDHLAAACDERERAIMTDLHAQETAKLARLRSARKAGNRADDRQHSASGVLGEKPAVLRTDDDHG